jgi:DNA-binding SARP family transcriptional activator
MPPEPATPTSPILASATTRFSLQTLGGLALRAVGIGVSPGRLPLTGKPLAILAYLACVPARSATREHLIDLLWADLDPGRGRATLRQHLLILRRLIGASAVSAEGDVLRLEAQIDVDRDAFLRAIDVGDDRDAVATYTGEFIPEFAAPGSAEFEQWADLERLRLKRFFALAAERVVRADLRAGQFSAARALAERVRSSDPESHHAWRLLLEVLSFAGNDAVLLSELEVFERILAENGAQPEPSFQALLQRLKTEHRRSPVAEDPPAFLEADFVGREQAFGSVLAAWQLAKRAKRQRVRLVGDAGLGKSRFLREVALRLGRGGAQVVIEAARWRERQVPFALASDLAIALAQLPGASGIAPASASTLVTLAPQLSASLNAAPVADVGDELVGRCVHALVDLISALAEDRAIVLLLDDMHWADPKSATVILGAVDRVAHAPVLAVFAQRPESPAPVDDACEQRILLPPLKRAEVETLIESLGSFSREEERQTVIEALWDASNGSPLLVLQHLHLAIQRGSLRRADACWELADLVRASSDLRDAQTFEQRTKEIGTGSRSLLLALSYTGAPIDEPVVTRLLEEIGAHIDDNALGELVRLGLVEHSAKGWQAIHDEIARAVLSGSSEADRHSALRALARAVLASGRRDLAALRLVCFAFVDAGDQAQAAAAIRTWLESPERGWLHVDPLPFVRFLLGDRIIDDVTVARLASGLSRRTSTRRFWLAVLGCGVAAMLGLGAAIGSWLRQPYELKLISKPISDGRALPFVIPPVVEVHDRLGRISRKADGKRIEVSNVGGAIVTAGGKSFVRNGVARFDSLVVDFSSCTSIGWKLIFTLSKSVHSAEWACGGYVRRPALRLESSRIGGQAIRGGDTVVVPPLAWIDGLLRFRYATPWPTATVMLAQSASWIERERDTLTLQSLITPAETAFAPVPLHIRAPNQPGRYRLLWVLGPETEGGFLLSATNWNCRTPIWHDGNDLASLSADSLRKLADTNGYYLAPWRYCGWRTRDHDSHIALDWLVVIVR